MEIQAFELISENIVKAFNHIISLEDKPNYTSMVDFSNIINIHYDKNLKTIYSNFGYDEKYYFTWDNYKNSSLEELVLDIFKFIEDNSNFYFFVKFRAAVLEYTKKSNYYKVINKEIRVIWDLENEKPPEIPDLTVERVFIYPQVELICKKQELARKLIK